MIVRDERYGFTGSIVSYPDRGPDGDRLYRGNTTGRIVRDFLATFHGARSRVFADPMEGGGTSRDAARAMGIPYLGLDLREGFDAARHDLLATLEGKPCGSIWLHPPYAGMIEYSGNMWGEPHPADLSRFADDVDAFHEMLQCVLNNAYRALAPGGHYGVLLGSWRKSGRYHALPATMTRYAPGELVSEIIKMQNNVTSSGKSYGGTFVPISHETLLVFRRAADANIVAVTIDVLDRIQRTYSSTWRSLVLGFARERKTFTLADLYEAFDGHPRAGINGNYKAKLRQIVRDEATFERYARGRYAVVSAL
jgi:hypothetical protein